MPVHIQSSESPSSARQTQVPKKRTRSERKTASVGERIPASVETDSKREKLVIREHSSCTDAMTKSVAQSAISPGKKERSYLSYKVTPSEAKEFRSRIALTFYPKIGEMAPERLYLLFPGCEIAVLCCDILYTSVPEEVLTELQVDPRTSICSHYDYKRYYCFTCTSDPKDPKKYCLLIQRLP